MKDATSRRAKQHADPRPGTSAHRTKAAKDRTSDHLTRTGPAGAHETVGVRELRDGLSRHLAHVRGGAEITVTDHGTPIARIVPVVDDAYARLVASGRLIPAKRPTAQLPRRLDVGPVSDLIER